MPNAIHVFRAGRHTDLSGRAIEFTSADLAATADAYDPAKHQAPIVVGHPKLDAPAYGWIDKLTIGDDGLYAEPAQIDPEFAEMVRAGRFKRVSASFYLPGAPANPARGAYYLKHVGFLGASAPAVKGLRPVQFAADGTDTVSVEFSMPADGALARIMRNLREWFLAQGGADVADRVVPAYDVETLEAEAREPETPDDIEAPAQAFAEAPKGDDMSERDRARLAELEAENARLRAEAAAAAAARRHDQHALYAETLCSEGLAPAGATIAVALMDRLSECDEPLAYGDGDARQEKSAVELLRELLALARKPVALGEHASAGRADTAASFAAPAGYSVDTTRAELHARALAYQAAHPGTDYLAAATAVQKGD